jgi:hypothetical protein
MAANFWCDDSDRRRYNVGNGSRTFPAGPLSFGATFTIL